MGGIIEPRREEGERERGREGRRGVYLIFR